MLMVIKRQYFSIVFISGVAISIASWLPRQEIAYLLPFLLYPMSVLLGSHTVSSLTKQFVMVTVALGLISGGAIYALIHGATVLHPLYWVVTHSSFLVVLIALQANLVSAQEVLRRFVDINIALGLIEVCIGVAQYLQGPSFAETGGAGDYVTGSLGNNSHLFALKMLMLLAVSAVMYSYFKRSLYLVAAGSFLVAWLLASALHTVVVFLFALVAFWLLRYGTIVKRARNGLYLALGVGGVTTVMLGIYPRALRYIMDKLSFVNPADPTGGLFGKVEYMKRTLVDLPMQEGPVVALFGTGPGSYSSRASWILSGEYLRDQKFVPVTPSRVWSEYQSDIWNHELLTSFRWTHGVANQPFSTWFTVLGEIGWVGVGAGILVILYLVVRYRRGYRVKQQAWAMDLGMIVLLLTAFAFFFDNWLEYPRYMMPVLFILVVSAKISFASPAKGKGLGRAAER